MGNGGALLTAQNALHRGYMSDQCRSGEARDAANVYLSQLTFRQSPLSSAMRL